MFKLLVKWAAFLGARAILAMCILPYVLMESCDDMFDQHMWQRARTKPLWLLVFDDLNRR